MMKLEPILLSGTDLTHSSSPSLRDGVYLSWGEIASPRGFKTRQEGRGMRFRDLNLPCSNSKIRTEYWLSYCEPCFDSYIQGSLFDEGMSGFLSSCLIGAKYTCIPWGWGAEDSMHVGSWITNVALHLTKPLRLYPIPRLFWPDGK